MRYLTFICACFLLAQAAFAFKTYGMTPDGRVAGHPIEAEPEAVWNYLPKYLSDTRHLSGEEARQAIAQHPDYIATFGVEASRYEPSATCSSYTTCGACIADTTCKWGFYGCKDQSAQLVLPECAYGAGTNQFPSCSTICDFDSDTDLENTGVGNSSTDYTRLEAKYQPSAQNGAISLDALFSAVGFNTVMFRVSGGADDIGDGPPSAYIQAGFLVSRPGTDKARGAWFIIMAESTYQFTIAGNPDGVDSTGATGLQLIDNATLTSYTLTDVPGGLSGQKYATIVYDNFATGGTYETKCYITNAQVTIGSIKLKPYEVKCDVNLKKLTGSAGTGWGIRFMTFAQQFSTTVNQQTGDTSEEDFGVGASGTLRWNTSAVTATSLVPIKVKGPTECGTLTWLTPSAQAQLAAMGFPTFRCLFFSFMTDNPAELLWDPEAEIDPAKAEAAALSPAAINAPSMFVAMGFAAVSALLARLH